MTKIERKTQKIFAGNAATDELAVFGSMITGTPVYNDDIEALQSEAYTEGWKAAVAANEAPFMEEMNAVQYGFSKQLAYLFQQGIAEWDAGTTYYLNSFCQVGGVIYKSMQDENINHSPADDTEGTYWIPLETGSGGDGGGLEVCDIGMSLYIDETKGLRRWLNGQIVAINQNTQGFLTRLKKIVALYPSLLTTEENWQAAKTLSDYGQVGKFVFNYAEDEETVESVRLPAVVNVQGLLDLQNLGMTVKAGLPNITGTSNGYCTAQISNGSGVSGCIYNIPLSVIQGATNNAGWAAKFGIDASLSNSIYGATDTVQEEAIQYPYFIQIATGQETEVNITNEIELNNPFVLFTSHYVETPLYNISWLKSDGEYHPKAIYPKAYEALVVEQNTDIAVGTTVDLPSSTKYTKRGLSVKLSTDKSATDYDFRINPTDETFRLPLKNHSADDGNTNLILYYYVGETVQNANLIDAGRMAEFYATKQYATSANFPSNKYIDLTLGPSDTEYTAPADGWYFLVGIPTSSNNNMGINMLSSFKCVQLQGLNTLYAISCFLPCYKEEVIRVFYTNINFSHTGVGLRFYYANGAQGGS